jgi:Phosphotransferase enzyme family
VIAPGQSGFLSASHVLSVAFPSAGNGTTPSCEVDLPIHVIPQGSEPRWIVLGNSRAAAPVLASWRPFKIGTRLRWSGVMAASALGRLSQLPGVVSSRAAIDLSYWGQTLPGFSEDWVPVVHVGNPSHTRKVIVFFIAPGRRFKAVAKVPLVPAAAAAILNEAHVLRHLHGADYLPPSLFQDPVRGIAAQSWLEGEPVSRRLTSPHVDLLARLVVPDSITSVGRHRRDIEAALERIDLPFDRSVLAQALEMLDDEHSLPMFIEHRDFAPWNLKRLPGGQSGAIDWEWTVLHGLPCQDIFRYFFIQDALFHGRGDVWRMLNSHALVRAHCRRFEIPSEALPPLVMNYLLRVLAMDWGSGNTALAEYSWRQITSFLRL